MSNESHLTRQWTLVRLLCSHRHGLTAREMAQELGVTERAIRRTLESFQSAGFPLEETVEEYGRKKWLLGFGRHAVVLEPAQLREELIAEAQSLLRQYESGALELAGI